MADLQNFRKSGNTGIDGGCHIVIAPFEFAR